MSITARILIGFALLSVAGYFFLLRPVLDRVERQYLEAAEEPLVDIAELCAGILANSWGRTAEVAGSPTSAREIPPAFIAGISAAQRREFEARIYGLVKTRVTMGLYVTDAAGIVLFDSSAPDNVGRNLSHLLDVSRTLQGRYGARSTRVNEEDPTSSVMFVGAPIMVAGEVAGVVSIAKPQRSMREFISETRRVITATAFTAAAGFLVAGLLLSRWVTDPLRRLTNHAAAISQGRNPGPPRMPGRHLRILGEALEQMRGALENRRYVEGYVRTLTHEMKGPVAGIAGAAELLAEDPPIERRMQFVGNIASEASRLQDLIDRMLALASLENRRSLETPQELRLDEILLRCVEGARSRAESAGVRFDIKIDAKPIVLGEGFLLETAIGNLVQNALDFSPAGGEVGVSLTTRQGDDGEQRVASVEILDSGPGIPEYARDRIFDRFYSLPRPATGRKSSGLGLCFVRESAVLHSGSVSISNRSAGNGAGTLARFELPVHRES